jgi:hypothetical protein
MDVPLDVLHLKHSEGCEICGSVMDKAHIMVFKKTDPKVSSSFLRLFQNGRQELQICFICFGENFTDRG